MEDNQDKPAQGERRYDELVSERRAGALERLKLTGGFASFGIGEHPVEMFPRLAPFTIVRNKTEDTIGIDNTVESLRFAMWMIYLEVYDAYILQLDRIAILGCRAVIERGLRIAYQWKLGTPADPRWTLGNLIQRCSKEGIEDQIISFANLVKDEGNNLAHAKWETARNWEGIEMRRDPGQTSGPPKAHYMTGNVERVLFATRDFLKMLLSE